ncbi:Ribosomal large subunit pseudouridine synthase D [Rubripirellula lacrimiformis]|uniref:Ribosomal large subunit pseudouridine synthase D n=1 Tax=Rubripirellula lacrimiformis TaxID=1930273 RepID=A0A517NFA5_9BACT|nr:RluA family pseudouridine synthase [Rubripirellula lacrimiformis]QDT05813.1 Ribosomal large subunit pseudouridine synthase D [Rubripirellula lacrimiformis]
MNRNQGYRYRHVVSGDVVEQSAASFMASTFDHSSKQQWQLRLDQGEVTRNDVAIGPDDPVSPGDVIVWERPGWIEDDVPMSYSILYQDEDLLAVDKPSGLPTLPGGGFYRHTLLSLVRGDFPAAIPLHRLGRCTSGILLFARNRPTAATVSKDWPNVQKQYRAVAQHLAAQDSYDIQTPIGPCDHPRLGSVHAATVDGKPSRSVARVVQRRSQSTIFDVDLHTGRPHQIRIHLASIGHPLVGDPLYDVGGKPKQENPGLPGDGGYQLRATRLIFNHPTTGRPVVIKA